MNFLAEYGEDSGGEHADRGTILHKIAEECLAEDRDPYAYVGEKWSYGCIRDMEITEDHADAIADGLDLIDSFPGKLYTEYRVDIGRWMPDQFGTLDVGICGKKRIVIFDWKFGGVPVLAVDNEQLMIYALAFWENVARHITDAEDFLLIIYQPFAPNGGGEWEVTLDELLEFGKELKRKARKTYDPNAPRIPGPKQCSYCDGAKQLTCREYNDYNLALLVDDFDEMDDNIEHGLPPRLPVRTSMTPERRTYILEHRPMFEKYLERLHADALSDALRGDPVPGLKAVYGRSPPRKWKEEHEEEVRAYLIKLLKEEAFVQKLLSPTMAEKELPERIYAKFKKFVDRGLPKPILVSDKDRRPRVPVLADLFDDDIDDEE